MRLTAVLAIVVASSLPAVAQAQALDAGLTVLEPREGAAAPRRMLSSALLGQANALFEARRKAVAALKTPEEIGLRQQALKARFLEALGPFPEKTPLNARVVGRSRGEGYHLERVIYESRPGHHVTALLYLPEGEPPFPGVLLPCGHSVEGKAGDTYQRASILLAKNGLAVLCYDPIGQGERVQLLDPAGKPVLNASTAEHTMTGVGALLVGGSTAGYRVWDGIRSLDYLASRPEIDPKRLGCTGNSGGGTMTAYLMALDDRIAVAAPSCYITSLERLFATIGPQDAEQNITGQVAFGMNHADYVTMRAPKPTLVCVGTRDYFDIQGAWDSFREAKLLYGKLRHGERVDLFESDEPHGFTRPRREAAMRWMRRWLLHRDDAPEEGELTIAAPAELRCTESGQVLRDLKGRSVFDFNRERADALETLRAARKTTPEALLAAVRTRIRLVRDPATVGPPRRLGILTRTGYRIEKLAFDVEPGIVVPGLLFAPEGAGPDSDLVIAAGGSRAELTRPGSAVLSAVGAGRRVLLVDLRGMGETAPNAAAGPRNDFGPDTREAFLALHLDRPLLGQRVGDLLAVVWTMAPLAPRGIELWGFGTAGPIALHAAALDSRVSAVRLERSLVSWSAVARTRLSRDQLSNAVPGALLDYDLPELAATIAPRRLTLVETVDPAGKPVDSQALEAAYAPCLAAYRARGAEDHLALGAGRDKP
jgi:cephalosporin-C deacetylase-like acetyl esterase